MQGGVTASPPLHLAGQHGFAETELQKRGMRLETGAPVTGAVTVKDAVAVGFGDGSVRFFRPGLSPIVARAHRGVVLSLAADGDHVVTGGDDGLFLRISTEGNIEKISSFGTRWVDCVAAGHGQRACSSGRTVHVWRPGKTAAMSLEHASTVGGLAFDARGGRLAVAHYGGVTVWRRGDRRWKSSKLVWKGSHGNVSFSPDGRFLVTAMQENAIHVWRLRDKADMQMAGYPAKIRNFVWVGDTPHLVTSGADEAICWPFDGKDGPLGRTPLCVAHCGKRIATCVQALPEEQAVFAGFRDGTVLLAELDETGNAIVLMAPTGTEVTAIAVPSSLSHVLVGDAKGQVLWAPLSAGDKYVRHV